VTIVVSKVFLFGEHGWLYCSDVRLKDGVYSGWVENGAWHLVYDTKTKLLESFQTAEEKRLGYKPVTSGTCDLTWMCYPQGKWYNEVITNAEERFKAGEKANYSLDLVKKKTAEDKDYELYLKLREKFDPGYDEVPF
jgi:hypothetical protein